MFSFIYWIFQDEVTVVIDEETYGTAEFLVTSMLDVGVTTINQTPSSF